MLRYAAHLGATADQAQDVVQEAFLRLHLQVTRHGRDSVDDLSPWLFRVVRNQVNDLGRRSIRDLKARMRSAVGVVAGAANAPATADDPPPLARLVRGEDTRRALGHLRAMPVELQEVLLLKVVADQSLTQIARTLGLTIGNAGYRLGRAVALLAERMKTQA